jgi:hypothetical protein
LYPTHCVWYGVETLDRNMLFERFVI